MVAKEDLQKTIFTYDNDKEEGGTQSGLKLQDSDITGRLVDVAEITTYDSTFKTCYKKVIKDLYTSYKALKKVMRDVVEQKVAFYTEGKEKVESTYTTTDGTIREEDISLNNIHNELNNGKNHSRLLRAEKELNEIMPRCPHGYNPFEKDIRLLINDLYHKVLMIPSVVYISHINMLQLRWQTDEITILVECNTGTKRVDGYLTFTKVDKAIGLDIHNIRDLVYIIAQFELYEF